MTTKKQKRRGKGEKERKKKVKRVLNLISEAGEKRGDESEKSVIEALKKLSSVINYRKTKKYSSLDKRGIDFIITTHFNGKRISFYLQVKSSFSSAREFIKQGRGKIAVLVKGPGASQQNIIDALSKIIERKQGGDRGIIEVAKLNTKTRY